MQNQHRKLIDACKRGNQKAQVKLYDSYCDAMYNVSRRYILDAEEAKDATQDGFLKAFLNIENYKPTATFGAWLKRIIINQCMDVLKRRKLEIEPVEVEELQIIDENDWHFEASITKVQILDAIEELSEKYRLVISLFLIEGYDHEEISEILNIERETSRTRLRRARLQLQEILKKTYNEEKYW